MGTGYLVSPHIPLSGAAVSDTVINFIRNLFPEGSAFDTLLESQQLSKNNLYAILKTIGHDTAGALSFLQHDYKPQATELRLVTSAEIEERLSNNRADAITNWDGKYRLSVAGVQKMIL